MNLDITILSTGTELTCGRSLDTNSQWLANQLYELGFIVQRFLVLPDDPIEIESQIRQLSQTICLPRLILMTGGLGPTEDDYTSSVISKIVQKDLVEYESALERLKSIYLSRGKSYADILSQVVRQTQYPAGSVPIPNHTGIAPGYITNVQSDVHIICLPGVPSEMKPMFLDTVAPWMLSKYQSGKVRSLVRLLWAMGESLFQETFIKKYFSEFSSRCIWGVTANKGYIKVIFQSEDKSVLDTLLSKLEREFPEQLTVDFFPDLSSILLEKKITLATAESCTAGGIAKKITDQPGSSQYFLGGVVAYDNSVKVNLLGVAPATLQTFGAVSVETAKEMLQSVQRIFSPSISVVTTGIAGPGGGSHKKPVGLVFIGIQLQNQYPKVYSYKLPGSREMIREATVHLAFFHIYKELL